MDTLVQKADIICDPNTDLTAVELLSETVEALYIFVTQYGEKSFCVTKSDLVRIMDGSNVGVWIDGYRRNVYVFKIPYIDVWVKKFPIPDETSIFYLYKAFVSELGTQFGINRMHGGADYTVYKVYPINKERFELCIDNDILNLSQLRREVEAELIEQGNVLLSKQEFIENYLREENSNVHNEHKEDDDYANFIPDEDDGDDDFIPDDIEQPTTAISDVNKVGSIPNTNRIVYMRNNVLTLYNTDTFTLLREVEFDNDPAIFIVPISNDYVAILDNQYRLRRWNVSTNALTALHENQPVGSIITHHKNNNILIAAGNKVIVFNIVTDSVENMLELYDVISIERIIYKDDKIGLLVNGNRVKIITNNEIVALNNDAIPDISFINFLGDKLVVYNNSRYAIFDSNLQIVRDIVDANIVSMQEFNNFPYYMVVDNMFKINIFDTERPALFYSFSAREGEISITNNNILVLTEMEELFIYNINFISQLEPSISIRKDNGLINDVSFHDNKVAIALDNMIFVINIDILDTNILNANYYTSDLIANSSNDNRLNIAGGTNTITYTTAGIMYQKNNVYLWKPNTPQNVRNPDIIYENLYIAVQGGRKCLVINPRTDVTSCYIIGSDRLWSDRYPRCSYIISQQETKYAKIHDKIYIYNMDTNNLITELNIRRSLLSSIFYMENIFITVFANRLIFYYLNSDNPPVTYPLSTIRFKPDIHTNLEIVGNKLIISNIDMIIYDISNINNIILQRINSNTNYISVKKINDDKFCSHDGTLMYIYELDELN